MFSCTKELNKFIYFIGAFIRQNQRLISTTKPLSFFEIHTSQIRLYGVMHGKVNKTNFFKTSYQSKLLIVRNKSKSKGISYKKRYKYESSDDDDSDDDENRASGGSEYVGKDVEMVTRSLKSMRVDLILKSILNINRKKIENNFYQNKIRINGKMLHKKSQNVKVGDQIDLIYGIDNFTLDTLKVGRVEIVKIEEDPDNDRVILKALKLKSLIIDNSSYEDEWREPVKED